MLFVGALVAVSLVLLAILLAHSGSLTLQNAIHQVLMLLGFQPKFKASTWKNNLGMTIARCITLRKEGEHVFNDLRRNATEMLRLGEEDKADGSVSLALKEKTMWAAYNVIQEYCEDLIDLVPKIQEHTRKECPEEMKEIVASLIYASLRLKEFKELEHMRALFSSKFGHSFVNRVIEDQCDVSSKMKEALILETPSWPIRQAMLEEISRDFKVNWKPAYQKMKPTNFDR